MSRHDHWLGASVKVRDKRLAAVENIHITPHMDKDVRNQICVESGRFLRGANAAIQMLQGDVNADMRTTWFKQALGQKGPRLELSIAPVQSRNTHQHSPQSPQNLTQSDRWAAAIRHDAV